MSVDLKQRVDRILEDHGGFYSFDDIVQMVREGKMQSFAHGDSWAVVQVLDFPRRRVVEIVLVAGTLDSMEVLEADVIGWSREIGASMIMSSGRNGWSDRAKERGWRTVSQIYMKDLSDGS